MESLILNKAGKSKLERSIINLYNTSKGM